jgi:hypothetical protein
MDEAAFDRNRAGSNSASYQKALLAYNFRLLDAETGDPEAIERMACEQ